MVSIERALSRFDTETKTAFMNFYTKIDPTINGGVEINHGIDPSTGKPPVSVNTIGSEPQEADNA